MEQVDPALYRSLAIPAAQTENQEPTVDLFSSDHGSGELSQVSLTSYQQGALTLGVFGWQQVLQVREGD